MKHTLRDLMKGVPRSTEGFPRAEEFCKKHRIAPAIVSKLKLCTFKGYLECESSLCLCSFAKLPSENGGQNRLALKHGFLIIGNCRNGDPLAVELATAKMVYLSHDIFYGFDPEENAFEECVARTHLAIDDFWWRAETEKNFPIDFYAATQ